MLTFAKFPFSFNLSAQNSLWILDPCFLQSHTFIISYILSIRIIKNVINKNEECIRYSVLFEISHIFVN